MSGTVAEASGLGFHSDDLDPRGPYGADHRRGVRHRRRARAPADRARHAASALIDVDGDGLKRVAAGLRGAETAVADVRDAGRADRRDRRRSPTGSAASTSPSPTPASPPAARCGLSRRRPSRRRSTSTCSASGARCARRCRTCVERRGHLLLVASAAAVLPSGGLGAYSAAKAGVEALGRSLRIELAPARRHGRGRVLPVPEHADGRRRPAARRCSSSAKRRMPPLIARTWPLEPAVRRTVDSIERRSRSVAHPRFLRALMLAARAARQPADSSARSRARCRTWRRRSSARPSGSAPDAAARGVGR